MKGRNLDLIRKRDEALCRRYYYWTEEKRLRFDDALKVLSEQEFFLSEDRILNIIRKCRREGMEVPKAVHVRAPRLTYRQLSLFKS